MNVYPPTVVYGALSTDRPVALSQLEITTLVCSVTMSRTHFGNAHLVCDHKWFKFFEDSKLLGLFTNSSVFEYPHPEHLPVFWASAAKKCALEYAMKFNPDAPQLLLDLDAIIWDATKIRWDDPTQLFVGGYEEPLCWEAYREQTVRLGELFCATFNGVLYGEGWATSSTVLGLSDLNVEPINGSCLYFGNNSLTTCYCQFIEKFMADFFSTGCTPRAFYKKRNNKYSGEVYFSEGMMADQRSIGHLVRHFAKAIQPPSVDFYTTFNPHSEYPEPSWEFFHLWKLKVEAASNPNLAYRIEQYLLKCLYDFNQNTGSLLNQMGFLIQRSTLPMSADLTQIHFDLVQL